MEKQCVSIAFKSMFLEAWSKNSLQFQTKQFSLTSLDLSNMNAMFSQRFRCYIAELDANTSIHTFDKSILSKYIPLGKDGDHEKCKKLDPLTNASIACPGPYIYDQKYYKESKVISVCTSLMMDEKKGS